MTAAQNSTNDISKNGHLDQTMVHRAQNNQVDNVQSRTLSEFEAVFEFATLGIIIADAKGRVVKMNRFAEVQFGYTREEVLGCEIETFIPEENRAAHYLHREQYMHSPSHRAMGEGRNLHGRRKDETIFPTEISLSHYTTNGDRFVIAFIIDISKTKQNEVIVEAQKNELVQFAAQMQKLNVELEQRVEDRTKMLKETLFELEKRQVELASAVEKEKQLIDLKSRFVTMASHEFRTPLSTILSSVSLIGKYPNPEDASKRDKHINRIKQAVRDMKDILEDFLSLEKMDDNKVALHPESFTAKSFQQLIKGIVNEMQRLAKQGQKIEYIHHGDSAVNFDQKMLRHVITNLISNAIKFSYEFSTITVESKTNQSNLMLSVTDTGIGISEDAQQHLFERFYRAENAANVQGTGLGLHIVGRYIDMAGGRVEMKSKLNEGTTFTVFLPQ